MVGPPSVHRIAGFTVSQGLLRMSGNMATARKPIWAHANVSRRAALQAGSIGILSLGLNHLQGLRESCAADGVRLQGSAKSCIFIFLSGGLAQHDSFDMKPEAPDNIRGEFHPPQPRLQDYRLRTSAEVGSAKSDVVICRSFTHGSNEHSAAHHIMLTGHSELPVDSLRAAPAEAISVDR